ncbi:MAG: hypothetical protein JNL60_11680 [Bacteroidia bacterium]|nr:hypothetical protein [Bacteroidia bacterium]
MFGNTPNGIDGSMKVIGDRISILKKEDLLSIVILPITNKGKLWLMFAWLLAWSICGVIVFANYFQLTNQDAKLFIIIYLAFWIYFEVTIIRAYIWKKYGKEKLWIQDGILHYQREVNKKGKIREFNLSLLSKLNLIELRATRFADTVAQSFWYKGGERLEFQSQATTIRLGMQITDEEAKTIMREVNQFIP